MKLKTYLIMLGLLLSVGSNLPLAAQEETTFDPTLPAEPNALYRVKVTADPLRSVSSLGGAGDYTLGTTVYVSAYSYSSAYTLDYWTKNGEKYEAAGTEQSFSYTVTNEDVVEFVAHYSYSPSLPDEPQSSNEWRLYFVAEPLAGGYFSRTSGEKHECGTAVDVTAYCNTGYDFVGWYNEGSRVSTNPSISYEMQNCHTTLTAKFVYNPVLPDEPGWVEDNQQENVEQYAPGDADGDGEMTVNDVVAIVNAILSAAYSNRVDADEDGELTINDAVKVVNQILGAN